MHRVVCKVTMPLCEALPLLPNPPFHPGFVLSSSPPTWSWCSPSPILWCALTSSAMQKHIFPGLLFPRAEQQPPCSSPLHVFCILYIVFVCPGSPGSPGSYLGSLSIHPVAANTEKTTKKKIADSFPVARSIGVDMLRLMALMLELCTTIVFFLMIALNGER